jgi:tRNA nucleotidyltransferase (CCA-adding enzyme)
LCHDFGKATTAPEEWPRHIAHEQRGVALVRNVCARLRVPHDCRDLAVITAREHTVVHRALELKPATIFKLLQRCDALRKPERFRELLAACECDYRGRKGLAGRAYPQAELLKIALRAALDVNAGAIAARYQEPLAIQQHIAQARLDSIKRAMAECRIQDSAPAGNQ